MSKWTCLKTNWTPVLVADATNFTDEGYMALKGGTSTAVVYISKIYIGGLSTTQSPMPLVVAIDHVIGTSSISGVLNNPVDRSAGVLTAGPSAFSTSTTKPQRSSTVQLWAPAMNAFGGIAVLSAIDPSHRISLLGNAADAGEISLSCANSGTPGAVSSHFEYEPI